MHVYLVQHGRATAKEEDAERPLTENGRTEVERVAGAARRLGVSPREVWHSGKTRARQTAEILAGRLGADEEVARDDLSPTDDPTRVAAALADRTTPVLVAGHLPHLSRLAGLLVTGDAGREVVAFRNAAITALVRTDDGWAVDWVLTPEMASGAS